jgi:hypothetical protein
MFHVHPTVPFPLLFILSITFSGPRPVLFPFQDPFTKPELHTLALAVSGASGASRLAQPVSYPWRPVAVEIGPKTPEPSTVLLEESQSQSVPGSALGISIRHTPAS